MFYKKGRTKLSEYGYLHGLVIVNLSKCDLFSKENQ